ncbi:MAG: hypothetical protein M1821_003696 [Bathelium mastoideum]|nr:MAG: hypothetical protein M1821_003696 [Bathelium mastoideum]
MYSSPTGTRTFDPSSSSSSQPSITSSVSPQSNSLQSTPAQQSEHLNAIRSSITRLQADVNGFLTRKMEEEKGLGKSEDAKAEDNYGEELPDDSGEDAEKASGKKNTDK